MRSQSENKHTHEVSVNSRMLKFQEFKAEGEKLFASMSEGEKSKIGVLSDKIRFDYCLCNPAGKLTSEARTSPNKPKIMGYALTALADVRVPIYPYIKNAQGARDVSAFKGERLIKEGEQFFLNVWEASSLISRPEYAGSFCGGDVPVQLTIRFRDMDNEPTPCLSLCDHTSIRKYTEDLAVFDSSLGRWVCKDEYKDVFGMLFAFEPSDRRKDKTKRDELRGYNQATLACAFAKYLAFMDEKRRFEE